MAITLSGSIFAMFLYLTLFVQDDLGYGPFAAGLRFLPITMLAFVVAPVAGKLSVRIKARYLLGTGLLFVAVGLLLMSVSIHSSIGLDGAAARVHRHRHRDRHGEPRAGLGGHQRRSPRAQRHGLGGQQHLPPGGDRHRDRRPGAVFQSQIQQKTVAGLGVHRPTGREVLARGGAALKGALAGGGVREAAAAIPSALGARDAAPRLPGRLRQHASTT